ncbi:MAG: flippase-like domain-containing protein [Bacteroidia bacterium]
MREQLKEIFKNRRFKQVLRLVLGIVAIGIIVYKVDLPKAWNYVAEANGLYLFLALLSFFTSRFFAAFRINELYRTQELWISQLLNLKLYFLAMFYNLFIPLVGGEGFKAIWLNKRYKTKYKTLVSSAFLDRLSGVALLAVLSIIYAVWSSLKFPFNKNWLFVLIPVIFIGHLVFMKLLFKTFTSSWLRINMHSLIIQLLQVATTYFILVALGVTDQINDYLFIFLLSSFAFVLPMIGAREMAFVFGAESLGLNIELSLAVSVLFYLCTAINSLMGSYFLLFPQKLETREAELGEKSY